MIICWRCGRLIPYTGELSDATLSMLGMTKADAVKEEHPNGLCNKCIEEKEMALVKEVAVFAD